MSSNEVSWSCVGEDMKGRLVHAYDVSVRLRIAYLSMMAAAWTASMGIGLVIQAYFSALLPGMSDLGRVLVMLGTPVAVPIIALLVAELFDVAYDSREEVLLAGTVRHFSIALGMEDRQTISHRFRVCFEVTFILAGLLGLLLVYPSDWSFIAQAVLMEAFLFGSVWVYVVMIAQFVCKVVIRRDAAKNLALLEELEPVEPPLGPAAYEFHVPTGQVRPLLDTDEDGEYCQRSPKSPTKSWSSFSGLCCAQDESSGREFFTVLNSAELTFAPSQKRDLKEPPAFLSRTQAYLALAIGLSLPVVPILLHAVLSLKGDAPMVGIYMFLNMVAVSIVSFGLSSLVRPSGVFGMAIVVFFLCQFGMLFASENISIGDPGIDHEFTVFEGPKHDCSTKTPRADMGYPVCEMTWGHRGNKDPDTRLTALDLHFFANAAYIQNKTLLKSKVQQAFQGSPIAKGLEAEVLADYEKIGRWVVYKVPEARTRVLAIRGTTTLTDAIADADLWASIRVLQAFSRYTPVMSLLATDYIRIFVGIFSFRLLFGLPRLYDELLDVAILTNEKSKVDGWQTVVTGHSLGGGLAQIVSAKLGLPALVFSPVGTGYSEARFSMEKSLTYRSVVTIQPDNDIVPLIDRQDGVVQKIECHADTLQCHQLVRSACELYSKCGDMRGRCFEEYCWKAKAIEVN